VLLPRAVVSPLIWRNRLKVNILFLSGDLFAKLLVEKGFVVVFGANNETGELIH
jgi:hypothetical protein